MAASAPVGNKKSKSFDVSMSRKNSFGKMVFTGFVWYIQNDDRDIKARPTNISIEKDILQCSNLNLAGHSPLSGMTT